MIPASAAAAKTFAVMTAFVGAAVAAIYAIDPPRRRAIGRERARRALNFAVALLALVVLSPALALIALAVKLSSRGPVFYSQTRIGLDRRDRARRSDLDWRTRDLGGKPFAIYKFRTMHLDAERATGAVWSAAKDPRVTPFGRFLRAHRLDELPQLINVLTGDMNVVGPRPERPEIFARLMDHIPRYRERQLVRPGITGLAQLHVPYDSGLEDVAEKIAYDLTYISRRSASMDARIMLRTVPLLLFGPLEPRARRASGSPGIDRRLHHGSREGGASGREAGDHRASPRVPMGRTEDGR